MLPLRMRELPIHIPLNGLLEVAFEAAVSEFFGRMEQSDFGDIRPSHGCVFRYMKSPGLRLTEIAERGNMTKQSAGEVIDDLVARGYVERVPDPEDGRAKLVTLTGRGEEAQTYGFGLLADIEQQWAEQYGAERMADLRMTLESITAHEAPFVVPELAIDGEVQ
jgi:DNA-binding MarR family transcriptional regulator